MAVSMELVRTTAYVELLHQTSKPTGILADRIRRWRRETAGLELNQLGEPDCSLVRDDLDPDGQSDARPLSWDFCCRQI